MMHTKDQKWFQQRNRKGIHWEIGIFQDIMQIILSVHGIIIKQFNQTIVAPKHQMFNLKIYQKNIRKWLAYKLTFYTKTKYLSSKRAANKQKHSYKSSLLQENNHLK